MSEYFKHESAYVDDGVVVGEETKIWHFSHVLSGSTIGRDCVIGQNVMIGPDVIIGNKCKVQNNVSIYKGITLEDGVLSLSGEKKSDRETKNKSFHLVERSFGVFHRSITLPTGVDAAQAKASFKDGLLVIEVPRSEAAKPRTLDIS